MIETEHAYHEKSADLDNIIICRNVMLVTRSVMLETLNSFQCINIIKHQNVIFVTDTVFNIGAELLANHVTNILNFLKKYNISNSDDSVVKFTLVFMEFIFQLFSIEF